MSWGYVVVSWRSLPWEIREIGTLILYSGDSINPCKSGQLTQGTKSLARVFGSLSSVSIFIWKSAFGVQTKNPFSLTLKILCMLLNNAVLLCSVSKVFFRFNTYCSLRKYNN